MNSAAFKYPYQIDDAVVRFGIKIYTKTIVGLNMNKRDYALAYELKKAIEQQIKVLDFKVFGSRAKGCNDTYSDLDILVVIDQLTKSKKDIIYDLAWEIGFKYDIFISPLIVDEYELTETPVKYAPIIKNIYNEGITI